MSWWTQYRRKESTVSPKALQVQEQVPPRGNIFTNLKTLKPMIREKTVLIHITCGQVAARRWHNSEPSPKLSHLLRRAQTTISGWHELKVLPSEKALLLHSVLNSLWKANVALRGQLCSSCQPTALRSSGLADGEQKGGWSSAPWS